MAELSQAELQAAAARVSSQSPTASRGPGGFRDPETQWEALRGKTARALVSDPDLVYYWFFLCTNKASAAVQPVLTALDGMIAAAEGLRLEQPVIPPFGPAGAGTLGLESNDLTQERLSAIEARIDKHISSALVPGIRAGSRVQQRGSEARTAYAAAKTALQKYWKRLYRHLEFCSRALSLNANLLQHEATKVPFTSLQTTLELEPSAASLTAYTVQMAAALQAVKAMAREVRVDQRLRLGSETFPASAAAEEVYEDGVLARITMSPSPAVLGIRSGDVVSKGGDVAEVMLVGTSEVAVRNSTISATSGGDLVIAPAAHSSRSDTVRAVAIVLEDLPTSAAVLAGLQRREGTSAAQIRDLVTYLCSLYALFSDLSAAAEAVLERVGGDEPELGGLLAALDAYDPVLPPKLRKLGDRILSDLGDEGYDAAQELLLQGRITAFLTSTGVTASRKGQLSVVGRELSVLGGT